MTKLCPVIVEQILVLVFLAVVSLGCAEVRQAADQAHKTAVDVRSETAQVAQKLQDTIDYVNATLIPANDMIADICTKFDPEGPMCVRVLEAQDETRKRVAEAQAAVDLYNKTGQHFDAALAAIEIAVDEAQKLGNLLHAISKGMI